MDAFLMVSAGKARIAKIQGSVAMRELYPFVINWNDIYNDNLLSSLESQHR